jgi:hypothetical protein
MPATSTCLSALCALSMALACTYRTDLMAGGAGGGEGGLSMGGATGGQKGMGGTALGGATASGGMLGGAGTARGGTPGSGGSGSAGIDRTCTTDDDCLQCIYASAPGDPDQCENALGCCGGPVMNRTACAINEAAWKANCSNRGFEPPICPCILCGPMGPSCKDGKCGYWGC